jgi:hypothetical protein
MAKDTKEKDQKKPNGQGSGQAVVAAISAAVEKGIGNGMKQVLDAQEKTNKTMLKTLESISASQEELVKGLHELALGQLDASADGGGEETEDIEAEGDTIEADATDAPSMSSASKKKASADDATEDSTDPTDPTEDDVDAEVQADAASTDDLDPTSYHDGDQSSEPGSDKSDPGELNEDATSHARSQSKGGSSEMSPGKAGQNPGIAAAARKKGANVASIAAAAKVIRTLRAEAQELATENKRLRNRVAAVEASLERYADRVERKSVSPEIRALLEKSGYDVREMMSSRQKLAVADVDALLASSGVGLEPSMRAAFKNQLLQMGLMENGEIRRYQ